MKKATNDQAGDETSSGDESMHSEDSTSSEEHEHEPLTMDESCPEDYQEYIRLLNESSGDAEALRQVREAFSAEFPLLPQIWLQWLDDAVGAAASSTDSQSAAAVAELFERALRDFHSDEVCARYILWASGMGMDYAKQVLERCAQVVGLRPDAAHLVWDSYVDIAEGECIMLAEGGPDESALNSARSNALAVFGRGLRVPHASLTDLWQRYVEFVGGEEHATEEFRAAYKSSMQAYRELEPFEKSIAEAGKSADAREEAFLALIAYETDRGQPTRIQAAYERALLFSPFSAGLWLQYVSWLDSAIKTPSVVIPAYDRACKLCPWSCALWQQSLLALEHANAPYESLQTVWDNAKSAVQTEEEGVALYRTYIYLTHRHIMKGDQQQPQFKMVEKLFKEALRWLKEQFGAVGHPTIQLMKNYAHYLYTKSKKVEEARKVWNEILSLGSGNTAAAWLEAISMERYHGGGDLANTRRLLYMAVNSVTDHPMEVFNALVQFEREEGTLEELDKALEKVNSRAKHLRGKQQPTGSGKAARDFNPTHHQKNRGDIKLEPTKGRGTGQRKGTASNSNVDSKPPSQPPQRQATATAESRKRPATAMKEGCVEDAGGSKPTLPKREFQYGTGLEKNKLFVRHVDYACTEEELRAFFNNYGTVTAARIVTQRDGKPKGIAYVDFASDADAAKALGASGKELHNRKIEVFLSDPSAKRAAASNATGPSRPPMPSRASNFGSRAAASNASQGADADMARPRVGKAGGLCLLPRSISKGQQPKL